MNATFCSSGRPATGLGPGAGSSNNSGAQEAPAAARRPRPLPPGTQPSLDAARILRALAGRSRYRYVQPRLLPHPGEAGMGWRIVSPNCSRQVDPAGGEIDIAWFEPTAMPAPGRTPASHWRLHARDHARQRWLLQADDLTLAAAITLVMSDTIGRFWP